MSIPVPKVRKKVVLPPSSPPFLLRLIVTALLMVIVFGISIAVSIYTKDLMAPDPTSFESCSSAKGSIIQESYPPICVSKKGIRFVKKISGNELSLPQPTESEQRPGICGGIAGIQCPSGYTCKLDGTYPDASGSCEPQ